MLDDDFSLEVLEAIFDRQSKKWCWTLVQRPMKNELKDYYPPWPVLNGQLTRIVYVACAFDIDDQT